MGTTKGAAALRGTLFTPGPYHRVVGRPGNGDAASQHEQLQNADGIGVVMLAHDGSPEGNANAELLTAAPDLYMALRHLTEAFIVALRAGVDDMPGFDPEKHSLVVPARAALTKAEGRSADEGGPHGK